MMPVKQRNESQEIILTPEAETAVVPSNEVKKRPKTRGEQNVARGIRPNHGRMGSHALVFESNSSFQSNNLGMKKGGPFFNRNRG